MLSNDAVCNDGLRANKKSHPHEYGWLDLGASLLEKSGGTSNRLPVKKRGFSGFLTPALSVRGEGVTAASLKEILLSRPSLGYFSVKFQVYVSRGALNPATDGRVDTSQ